MIPFGEAVSVRRVSRLVLTCHVSAALGMKHLVAPFGLALTSSCLGLGLIYLVIIEWSRYKPSLWTGKKRVFIIIIKAVEARKGSNVLFLTS
jgi:hypothetical protein